LEAVGSATIFALMVLPRSSQLALTPRVYSRTLSAMLSSVSTHDPRRTAKVTLKAVMLLSSVLTIVFLISFVFSEQGISELQRSRRRVQNLRNDLVHQRLENVRLREEIESLQKSTFAVERIAREDLSMSRPGEIVYLLPPVQKN
jgi:cell division protein FtsB